MIQLFVLIFLVTVTTLNGDDLKWEKDYQKAVTLSQKTNKPILLFFTGSDCSGWGMKLKNEILSSNDFIEKTQDHFIFVEIDFPEHKEIEPALAEQNLKLKEMWKVNELPRLILVDHGREIARFGSSSSLSAAEFAEDILLLLKKNTVLSQLMNEMATLKGSKLEELYRLSRELERESEAQKILECGYERGLAFFLIEKYRFLVDSGKGDEALAQKIREKLLSSDPQQLKKICFSLALIDFQKLSQNATDKSLAIKPLEDYLSRFGEEDKENRWRLEMMIAQYYLDSDDWNKALIYAEAAYSSAPEGRREEIARSLHYIRGEAVIAGK